MNFHVYFGIFTDSALTNMIFHVYFSILVESEAYEDDFSCTFLRYGRIGA
jgi:hypothetical protein